MESKITKAFLFLLLSIIFTIGLTFASIELPRLIDHIISDNAKFVNVYTGGGELQELKTEYFIRHFHIRTIGYFSLVGVIILIIVGFVTEKTGLTALGAFALFLPVFGHFAATMFFLGGLGFLRLMWLPGLDITFDLMRLGNAVFIPYRIIIDFFNLLGINLYRSLPYILIISGLLIFCLGTVIWLYTYYNKIGLARVWIYKISRHPQYLGWLIWSYGILFLPGANMKQSYAISDSLPWLISALIIIGVAMFEEINMVNKHGKEYLNYRKKSYFMLPIPKYFCRVISSPFRVFFNKNYPTNMKEIAAVLSFYFLLIVLVSYTLNSVAVETTPGKWVFESSDSRSIDELAQNFIETQNRREKYSLMELMLKKGDSSLPYFTGFSKNPDPVVREFSADALGILRSQQNIQSLIELLKDNNGRVVRSALRSLGNYESDEVIESLTELLKSEDNNLVSFAAGALVRIRNEKSTIAVIPFAKDSTIAPNSELILALSDLGTKESEELIIRYMNDKNNEIRQVAVIGAVSFDSPSIKKSLSNALNDNDWEVRLYAEEVLKEIEK